MKLNKYSDHLVAYRQKGILPQGDIKNQLADIYEEMWPENKKWGVSKITRNCVSCISDMMKSLCAKFEEDVVEHKFVEVLNRVDEPITVEDLKSECDAKGIKYHHKAGIKKLTELLNDN